MEDIKVLIADDQGLIRESLSIVLKYGRSDLPLSVYAEDGKEAIQLCEELAPDVVLMDINMPNIDGVSATKVNQRTNGHRIKVIILTSYQDVDYVVSCISKWSGRLSS